MHQQRIIAHHGQAINYFLQSGVHPRRMEFTTPNASTSLQKGDANICNNYRDITISSCIGKVSSSIPNNRLTTYLDENKKLSDYQAAYGKGYSTIDHLYILKGVINKYVLHNKTKLYCCLVDFNEPFDSVPRVYRFPKLLHLGIRRLKIV